MGKIMVTGVEDPYNRNKKGGDVVFTLVTSPEEGRKQIMDFQLCKAYLHDATTAFVFKDNSYNYSDYIFGKSPNMDMERLRLLVGTDKRDLEEFKKRLFNAKKVINILEKEAGWDVSKIATVEHNLYKDGVWLLTGPKEWMSSPHMISMITLILRVICRNDAINPLTEKNITNTFKKWSSTAMDGNSDRYYLADCWDKLFVIMRNYNELFKGLTLEEAYDYFGASMHSNGISYLCSCCCGSKKLNDRMKRLLNKHKLPIGNVSDT